MSNLELSLEMQSFSIDIAPYTYTIHYYFKTGWTISRREIGRPKIPPTSWNLVVNSVGGIEFRHTFHKKDLKNHVLNSQESVESLLQDIQLKKIKLPSINNDNVDVTITG